MLVTQKLKNSNLIISAFGTWLLILFSRNMEELYLAVRHRNSCWSWVS